MSEQRERALEEARKRLIFALDYESPGEAETRGREIGPYVGCLKVGLELFIRGGPQIVRTLRAQGVQIFLDLKLHDITETVDRAVASATQLGVRYLTLHASGGPRMLERAQARAEKEGGQLKLLAVTVLTSLDAQDLERIGYCADPRAQAERLALLAKEAGLAGLVCSAQEVREIRAVVGPSMLLCTPGIRPTGSDAGDQKRVANPRDALLAGSDLLVVGRPIRDAQDPIQAAQGILSEMGGALEMPRAEA